MSDTGVPYPLLPEVEGDYPTKEVKPRGYCAHRQTRFNTTSRRVHCVKCSAEVDAFDVLVMLAKEREHLDAHRNSVVRETRIASARLKEIKRQERNAKARMRRGQITLDGHAVDVVEREARSSLRPAPRVGGGAVDPLTLNAPDSKESVDDR